MTVVCIVGAALLGGVFVATDRYQAEARANNERSAIVDLLGLDSTAQVSTIRQYLSREDRTVVYRRHADGADGPVLQLVFDLDGTLRHREVTASGTDVAPGDLEPLGRLFVARKDGRAVGFVIEGEARGYKNRIGFFVGLDASFKITGVRVLEHEEDPGLGAEITTGWFQGQYVGRAADDLPQLDVTRDPMPEKWRAALMQLDRMTTEKWEQEYGRLAARKREEPIHAITGATISSRALTDGVRSTVGHFRRRWELLSPHLEQPS
jgi:electron transport complex protein RnfG